MRINSKKTISGYIRALTSALLPAFLSNFYNRMKFQTKNYFSGKKLPGNKNVMQKLARGYTLVELLVYVGLFFVISTVVIYTLLSFVNTYRTSLSLRLAEHSGIDAMERMTRDIRSAVSVNIAASTLGSSPGVLTLTTPATTTKFYVQSGALKVDVNGSYFGPLSLSNVSVTNLVFNLATNTNSSLIKVDLTVQGAVGSIVKTKTYHTSVVLKGH